MGLSGSGISEETHIVSGSWIAWLICDSIVTILSVPYCPYNFVPYHFVLEPFDCVHVIPQVAWNMFAVLSIFGFYSHSIMALKALLDSKKNQDSVHARQC